MSYEIAEVPAYRLADGRVVPASEVTEITGYQTSDGTLYVSKEEARKSLVVAAIQIVGAADAFTIGAAHAAQPGTSTEDVDRVRYAILYLASVMQGAA